MSTTAIIAHDRPAREWLRAILEADRLEGMAKTVLCSCEKLLASTGTFVLGEEVEAFEPSSARRTATPPTRTSPRRGSPAACPIRGRSTSPRPTPSWVGVRAACPVAEGLARSVCSLPIFPAMTDGRVAEVARSGCPEGEVA